MRRNILVVGAAITVIGIAMMFIAGLPWDVSALWNTGNEKVTIPVGYMSRWKYTAPIGSQVVYSFSSDKLVSFQVVNSENYKRLDANLTYSCINEQWSVKSGSFTLKADKTDEFNFILTNIEESPVNVSVNWTISPSPIHLAVMAVIIIGIVIIAIGNRLKPRFKPIPPPNQ